MMYVYVLFRKKKQNAKETTTKARRRIERRRQNEKNFKIYLLHWETKSPKKL